MPTKTVEASGSALECPMQVVTGAGQVPWEEAVVPDGTLQFVLSGLVG